MALRLQLSFILSIAMPIFQIPLLQDETPRTALQEIDSSAFAGCEVKGRD
jgi:hypothetical protein